MKAKVLRPEFTPGQRIIAISDIHGNLPYLRALLEKLHFGASDALVLVGDLLEKGPQSLETLRYVMQLCRAGDVYPICGNCDGWYYIFDSDDAEMFSAVREYMNMKPQALLSQMCAEIGYPVTPEMDMLAMRETLGRHFSTEFDFIRAMPTIIDTPKYTFVHGGLPEGKLEELDAHACMKNDNFMRQGRHFDKWVIVGHWPVMLYGENITCANPIIDGESHIISIDGGNVLKDDGQLNALIIPEYGQERFECEHYDSFETAIALDAQAEGKKSWYIRWGDNRVRVITPGEEFSLCEHIRTGYRMEILTKYLTDAGDGVFIANDCTDYVLPVSVGDTLSIVERTSRGVLCKRNGVSGWYSGRLRMK
jgi:protein phosphatase